MVRSRLTAAMRHEAPALRSVVSQYSSNGLGQFRGMADGSVTKRRKTIGLMVRRV